MTYGKGKTSPDRARYVNEESLKFGRVNRFGFRVETKADLGETHIVSYAPSTIKVRLQDVSDRIREHRTPELIAERDEILLEAEAAGWTHQEMRAACRFSSTGTIGLRLHHLHALQTAESPPTRSAG
jgi:hypothetical protein